MCRVLLKWNFYASYLLERVGYIAATDGNRHTLTTEAKKCTFLGCFRTVSLLVQRWLRSALFFYRFHTVSLLVRRWPRSALLLDCFRTGISTRAEMAEKCSFFEPFPHGYLCSCRDGREVHFASAWFLSACGDG